MVVDLSAPSISFVNKTNSATCTYPIAEHFQQQQQQQQQVYVFIYLYAKGDSVSVLQY